MNNWNNTTTIVTVRTFLKNPLYQKSFDAFFKLCFTEAILYLRILRSSGWHIPTELVQNEKPFYDLAHDILGPLLASKKNQPFYVIFDYFNRHDLQDFSKVGDDVLMKHFRVLIRGFVRKEVTLLRGLENPQIHNLKRRCREILDSDEYQQGSLAGEKIESVWLTKNFDNIRDDRPVISHDALVKLIQNTFVSALNRSQWCKSVFNNLNEQIEFQNALPLFSLISIMVEVNAGFAGEVALVSDNHPTPKGDYLRTRIQDAIYKVMIYLEEQAVFKQSKNINKLDSKDLSLVLIACRQYLEDLGLNGNTGSVPSYFLSLKPEISQQIYQKRYKYILDSLTIKGVNKLREILRNDSTIWSGSDYIIDEIS